MIPGSFSELRLAVISDIHLGHKRNPAAAIIQNLMAAFPDNAETARLDIIFLAGDVFDNLLTLPHDDVVEIDLWVSYFLRLCKKHDIMLRVLEGTPGHDWQQSQRFEVINQAGRIGADLKYVKDLSIEYIERYGITVLYVPDEWGAPDKTLSQVHDLLRAKGLDKVDFAIMHGQFEYQLPPQVKAPKHDSRSYLELVRHLIFIGHVHTHTRYERIIAQGSFDRLAHGEEGPKGHVRALVRANGEADVVFHETVGAKKFITVDVGDASLEETLERVDYRLKDLPPNSFVRVRGDYMNPIFTNMDTLIRKYPLITWSSDAEAPKEKDVEELGEEDALFQPISITADNITRLLMERISASGASSEILQCSEAILSEVL